MRRDTKLYFLSLLIFFITGINTWASEISEKNIINTMISQSIKSGNDQELIKWAKELEKKGNIIEAYIILGRTYIKINNFELAELYLKQAIDINPKQLEAYKLLSILYFKKENYLNALNYFETYYKNSKNILAIDKFNYAELLWWNKKNEEANKLFHTYIKYYESVNNDSNINIYSYYWSYYRLNKIDTAINIIKKYLVKNKYDCAAIQDLLGIYLTRKKIDDANNIYKQIIDNNCSSEAIYKQKNKLDMMNKHNIANKSHKISTNTNFKYTDTFYMISNSFFIEIPLKETFFIGTGYRILNLRKNYFENFHTLWLYAKYTYFEDSVLEAGFKKYLNYSPECLPLFFNYKYIFNNKMYIKLNFDNHNRLLYDEQTSRDKLENKKISLSFFQDLSFFEYDINFSFSELLTQNSDRASIFNLHTKALVQPSKLLPLKIGIKVDSSSMVSDSNLNTILSEKNMQYLLAWQYGFFNNTHSNGFSFNFESAIGGDASNNINFGKIINFSFNPFYSWNVFNKVGLKYSHYTETKLKSTPNVNSLILELKITL